MLYLSGVLNPKIREVCAAGRIGTMNSPAIGYRVRHGLYALDNARFGKKTVSVERWWSWVTMRLATDGADRCLFVNAPDTPFDAEATLRESLPWLERIRELGVPAAFAAQNGSERPGMIPWDDLDVLFLGGDTAWKLGMAAADLTVEAGARGKRVHMGRANSYERFDHAVSVGVDTADGTFLKQPDKNLPRLEAMLDKLERRQSRGVQYELPLQLSHHDLAGAGSAPAGATRGA